MAIQRDMRAKCQRAAGGDPLDPQERKHADELAAFRSEVSLDTAP